MLIVALATGFRNSVVREAAPNRLSLNLAQTSVQTLVYLNSNQSYGPKADEADYYLYPKEFRNTIGRDYVKDEIYPNITVYHRRADVEPYYRGG